MIKASRGPRADGEATRNRILQAAGALFAATGYAETTSKEIATQAQVDLASINYHFGSRSGLYQAVLVEAHHQLVNYADLQQIAGSTASPPQKLRIFIDLLVDRAIGQPEGWHLHVLARELLAPSSHLQLLVQNVLQPKLAVVRQILSDITNIPPDDPALTRCLLSVAAPCLMLLVGARGIPGPLQEARQMSRDAIVDHLCRFSLGGLRAIAAQDPQDATKP
ncbi:TetR/AcrR family transcriptional regulator [Bordetella genomosp. 4]|uniref:TetR/AcrR family transcriptional regulator n=1 Tax=Bordetella genomosp. 4 TaxID=463044 RepID=UPI000B9E75EE|nr:CerR family C-terminal domain-containing protein [Bordetella genomosp. 4]OZI54157.1 transcriptional regulator [Bordetella genomosp. 4]